MRDGPCTVVLFYPKEIENSIFAEPVSEGRKTEKMLFFDLMYSSCENVISEMLFAKECKGVAGHVDGKICIILQGSFLETDKEKYRKLLQEIADFHREVLKIRLCVFMAAPCDSFAGLPDCYQHAMELKGIKKFWGDELDDIVFENEILGKQGMWIGGNTTVQKRLINLLIVRDFVSARQLIQNELFRHYDKDANSLSHTCLNIMSMVSMVVDAVADGGTEKDECFCQSLHLDTRLYGAQSAQQLKQETLKLLDQIVEYNERKECGEQPGWIIKVRNFIEEHYADSMLDVSMIAQTFELNVSYMSRTFKKYIGVGILEYIHQVRLQHGKKMLVGGASVRETAEQCGYIDSKALIRAFKRYEGVTPGQWSEMQNGGK